MSGVPAGAAAQGESQHRRSAMAGPAYFGVDSRVLAAASISGGMSPPPSSKMR
jgi:hypothetical protein